MKNLSAFPIATLSEDAVRLVATTDTFKGDIQTIITNKIEPYNFEGLRGKTGFLMISIKNPRFSRKLIDRYCQFAISYLEVGYLSVVDLPYLRNVAANFDCEKLRVKEVEKLNTISSQIKRRAQKSLNKYSGANLSMMSWEDLVINTPEWVKQEVTDGFNCKGRLYNDILKQTQKAINFITNTDKLIQFAHFLVDELPVLFYLYYLIDDGIVDFYPGENTNIVWKLEAGHYREELPKLSQIAIKHRGLIYVDFQENK